MMFKSLIAFAACLTSTTAINSAAGGHQKSYKESTPFEKRKEESDKIRKKYPERIPVICEKQKRRNDNIPEIDKNKYLVPSDLTVGQFQYVIRKRISVDPDKAIFIFINNVLAPTASQMSRIYDEHKDDDGFLYVVYSGEETFGADMDEYLME